MTRYLAWWLAGGAVGVAAGLAVLHRRGGLARAAPVAYVAAVLGCLYGAKVQYRLRFFAPTDAVLVAPADLLAPGFHIPLGLAVGFGVAMLAGRALGVRLAELGDALAMTGAVMMPIGRIGCLVAGCCLGALCPTWLSAVCVPSLSFEPTAVIDAATGLAALPAPTPRRVHLLPAYFALLGAATAAVQVQLLRRRMPPGSLVAAGFLIYPLGQLAIERLRDAPADHAAVMTPVLVTTVLVDLLVVGWVLATRAAVRRRGVPALGPAVGPVPALGRPAPAAPDEAGTRAVGVVRACRRRAAAER